MNSSKTLTLYKLNNYIMNWLEKCLSRCTFIQPDTMYSQNYMKPMKPLKPKNPKRTPLNRTLRCVNIPQEPVLILTPRCEGKSPHQHRFTFSDISVSPHCSSCFEKGEVNHKLFVLCKDCDYTLCQDCYSRDVSPYLSDISC